MATIKIQDLEQREVSSEEAKMVQGGWELENVRITSYQVSGGSESTFTGGVRVATGDVKG
ncbi:MAG: hypothetical protein KF886_06325 [Candidatus Hydrogenedentes bacterium]|nr:hypothetical protein [Candidatus Hydrogenedentota bacterium]